MRRHVFAAVSCLTLVASTIVVTGCSGGSGVALSSVAEKSSGPQGRRRPAGIGVIQHVVVIVQENRSVDDLFQQFNDVYPSAGLDTQSYGYNSKGHRVQLTPQSLDVPYDLSHQHALANNEPGGFVTEFNDGAMNGWNLEQIVCKLAPGCPGATAFGYVPKAEVVPYYQLAHSFAIADHVFQPNEGPSFPAHQYLIAGQSGGFSNRYAEAENPVTVTGKGVDTGGCNVPGAFEATIDMQSAYPGTPGQRIFPCETYSSPSTVLEELDAAYPDQKNWQYYTPSLDSIWSAPMGVSTIYNNAAEVAKVRVPESLILDAVKNGTLAKLSYVIPCFANSDHSSSTSNTGPLWVASVVNAIGESKYWDSTAILIVWDDWGGWFDHYTPEHPSYNPSDPYEYGFRVPMLVVSPYVKQAGLVDHTVRNATSILSFIERVFGLGSLNTLDQYSDDLTAAIFDFRRTPLSYTPVSTGSFDPTMCSSIHALEDAPVDD